jgi:phosphotriesterase-related protein
MAKQRHDDDGRLSRRDALGRVAAGIGILSVLKEDAASARGAAPDAGQSPAAPALIKKGTVQTVLGRIETSKLGFTLSHEHIATASPGIWQSWPELFGGRAPFVRQCVDILKQARDEGLTSFMDVSPIDLGRDIRLMEEISRKSGVQVVACTGHWLDPSRTMNARTVEELTDFFIHEIEVGIDGTDIKASVIKVANGGATINGFGERHLRAAARASKATGVPVTTHSPATRERTGEAQAAIFESEGLSPSRVCIGHSDNSPADYKMGLIKRGYFLGMDQFPGGLPPAPGAPVPQQPGPQPAPLMLTLDERLAHIKTLVDAGFANQIMLSNDWSLAMIIQPTANDRFRKGQNPDGIQLVIRKVIPGLKRIGVTEQAIRTMTVDAPKRYFDGV